MKIRKPTLNSSSSPSSSSLSSSSSSSSSSYSFSSLTNNSLASSTDSSSSAPSTTSTSTCTTTRCQGLDLLVKAIHLVTAGSVVGVPYIQKRVITRRRRRIISFDSLFISEINFKGSELPKRQQRKQRLKSVPTKYQDSVLLQSSKPKPKSKRLQRSANKTCEQLGS